MKKRVWAILLLLAFSAGLLAACHGKGVVKPTEAPPATTAAPTVPPTAAPVTQEGETADPSAVPPETAAGAGVTGAGVTGAGVTVAGSSDATTRSFAASVETYSFSSM